MNAIGPMPREQREWLKEQISALKRKRVLDSEIVKAEYMERRGTLSEFARKRLAKLRKERAELVVRGDP